TSSSCSRLCTVVMGQTNGERGALIGFTGDVDGAAVTFYDLAHNDEAQTGAGFACRSRCTAAAVRMEKMGHLFGRHAFAAVGNADEDLVVVLRQGDVHAALGIGEFHGVGEQIVEHLL